MLSVKISKFYQQCLWEKIIYDWLEINNNHDDNIIINNLLNLHCWDLAKLAQEAWYRLKISNIPITMVQEYLGTPEVKVFLEWLHNYQLICKNFNYEEQLSNELINNIYFIIKADCNNITNCNHFINHQFKIACQDPVDELHQAAKWALDPKIKGNIGVIVIDLENIYAQVDYIFSNYLNLISEPISDPILNSNLYDLIIDSTLYNHPAIKIMLLILQITNGYLNNQTIKYEDFSRLLRTKFIIGSKEELSARAYVDYLLRKEVESKFNWQYIKNCLLKKSSANSMHNSMQIFITICDNFEKVFIKYNLINSDNLNNLQKLYVQKSYNCEFWVQFVKEILQAFSWFTEEVTDKSQILLDYLEIILDQYLNLQDFLGLHNFKDCYKILIKMLQDPEINYKFLQSMINLKKSKIMDKMDKMDKHIKITNLSKAIQFKEQFDYLWICGFNENNWANQNQFNPFLPIKLQKKYGEDYGYSDQPMKIYQQYLNYLKNHTKHQLICSYSLYIENNPARISMLINHLPMVGNDLSNNSESNLKSNFEFVLEKYQDENTSLYSSNEFSGTEFLKLQIACPFQANAKIRLQAHKLEVPLPYLTKAFKGEVLHKTLAKFWSKYIKLSQVKALSNSEIYKELKFLANQSLLHLSKLKKNYLNETLLDLEVKRITDLCYNYIINYDLTRSDFKLTHIEKKLTVQLAEFLIKIKVDRIDELTTGESLIIDYKTGRLLFNPFNLSNYQDLNIDDPQLFIYSLYENNLKAVLLANIRTEKIQFIGLIDSKIKIFNSPQPTTKLLAVEDWQNYLNKIYAKLYKLIHEFKQGNATVKPKYLNNTCRICELQTFCRIFVKK